MNNFEGLEIKVDDIVEMSAAPERRSDKGHVVGFTHRSVVVRDSMNECFIYSANEVHIVDFHLRSSSAWKIA